MIYVFLADGFEETEAIAPIDMLRRAKKEVVTVGVTGKVVTSSHGVPVTADITQDEIQLNDQLEMIVLPGGMPGTLHLEKADTVQRALDRTVAGTGYICAICAAPSILGHKGLLKGKRAVCFPGYEQELDGALPGDEAVVTDGRFITAVGAGVAIDFGLEIVRWLCSPERAALLRASMQCR